MLLLGRKKTEITIQTPKGILFQTEILEITRSETEVTCAVRKDGGDDPDITSGTLIFSTVRFADGEKKIPGQNNRQFSGIHVKAMQEKRAVICIDGGKGVGRVTKPGLDHAHWQISAECFILQSQCRTESVWRSRPSIRGLGLSGEFLFWEPPGL